MSRTAGLPARLALALASAAFALLVAEGVVSLLTGRSLTGRPLKAAPTAWTDPDRGEAQPASMYCVAPDPLVGYVHRPNAALAIYDGAFRTDELGLRARSGPPRGPDPLRIVLLGDSVVMGFGLGDEDTLATRLEAELTSALAPGARPVECRSVAVSGWNHRNAVACLLDHLDVLDPDIVLYMPIDNDLLDSDGVSEVGSRRTPPDAASTDPWLSVHQGVDLAFARTALAALQDRDRDDASVFVGTNPVQTDLGRESRRRYDENAASVALLARCLQARGARLALLQYADDKYMGSLRSRLDAAGLKLPVVPLFTRLPAELTLGFDPHPGARAVAAMAHWTAADVLALGWVAGAAGPLPSLDDDLQSLRAPARSSAESGLESLRCLWKNLAFVRPRIDFRTLEGSSQIYGGINFDGSAGSAALLLLARAGPELHLKLAALPERPDLYPLEVAVSADDVPLGSVTVPRGGVVDVRLPLPAPAGPAALSVKSPLAPQGKPLPLPLDVRLSPASWVVVRRGTQPLLASFRPLIVACEPAEGR